MQAFWKDIKSEVQQHCWNIQAENDKERETIQWECDELHQQNQKSEVTIVVESNKGTTDGDSGTDDKNKDSGTSAKGLQHRIASILKKGARG